MRATLRPVRGFAIPVLFLVLLNVNAQASLTAYSDFPSWSSAVGSTTTVTIPDPAPNAFISFGSGDASVTYDGVLFSQSAALSNGNFFNVGPGYTGSPAVLSSQGQTIGVANILITLPEYVTAISLAYGYGTFDGSGVTFLLSNGDSIVQGSTGSGYDVPDFFGVTDTTPFNTLLVTTPDYVLNLNNLVYGNVQGVPEPSSLAICGLAGLGIVLYARARGRRGA